MSLNIQQKNRKAQTNLWNLLIPFNIWKKLNLNVVDIFDVKKVQPSRDIRNGWFQTKLYKIRGKKVKIDDCGGQIAETNM